MKQKIKEELLDQLLESYEGPADLLGTDGLLNELKKRLIDKTMARSLRLEFDGGVYHGVI